MALFTRPPVTIRDRHFPGKAPIDFYGNGGFAFAKMSHQGSLICLPSGIYAWGPANSAEISLDALAPVLAEADQVEILVLGCGKDIAFIAPEIRDALRDAKVAIELMATGPAVRTYNILLSEDRPVAAALIAVG